MLPLRQEAAAMSFLFKNLSLLDPQLEGGARRL